MLGHAIFIKTLFITLLVTSFFGQAYAVNSKCQVLLAGLVEPESPRLNQYFGSNRLVKIEEFQSIQVNFVKLGVYQVSNDGKTIAYLKIPSESDFIFPPLVGENRDLLLHKLRPIPRFELNQRSMLTRAIDVSLGFDLTSEMFIGRYKKNMALLSEPVVASNVKPSVDELGKLLLLDLMTGELDRHGGNFVTTENGSIKTFDNELNFPVIPTLPMNREWVQGLRDVVIPILLKEPIIALVNGKFFDSIADYPYLISGDALSTAKVRNYVLVNLLKKENITYGEVLSQLQKVYLEYRRSHPYFISNVSGAGEYLIEDLFISGI